MPEAAAVADPEQTVVTPTAAAPAARRKRRRQPRYHVVLWNDDDHTFQYVIAMLSQLFGHPAAAGIVLTTTREHAELKRDQIHAFGPDRLIARSKGSMSASIEPEA
ncbi:MAG: ATP-dependent Clp protease adaptor ClpS [Planctomycetia bacterium]|nr:ATP-dependent Clp protease adaptor ClpS [Planctomycetia bacterium]